MTVTQEVTREVVVSVALAWNWDPSIVNLRGTRGTVVLALPLPLA